MNQRLISFLEFLNPSFTDVFGYPNIEFFSDYFEVYFGTFNTIRNYDFVNLQRLVDAADDFRMFGASTDKLMICFTIYAKKE